MRKEEIERLRHRNQYVLVPESITCPFLHQQYEIDDRYRLYAHCDLQVTQAKRDDGARIWMLGDMYDYEHPLHSNSDIMAYLITFDFQGILHQIGKYTGRFVLICRYGQNLYLVHDATAARKIYYSNGQTYAWFSSQPQLLAQVLRLEKTQNSELLDYYSSPVFLIRSNASVGDITIYDEIKQLMPNHFFDVHASTKSRYWPSCTFKQMSLEEAASNCAHMVQGFMDAITNRSEVMIPLTAGKDSRTLLAATKDYQEQVFFYINKSKQMDERCFDISIPRKMLNKLGLKFHVVDPCMAVDDDFRKVYFENNELASERFLPLVYNYYLNYGNKVNLPGNTATAGSEWFMWTKFPVTAENLAKKYRVDTWKFAIDYYDQWIKEVSEHRPQSNVSLFDLFYWEERIANWGNQIQQDKDIAQEDINLFNSRDLIMHYLSVRPKYLEIHSFKIYLEVISLLWPELLNFPINKCFRKKAITALKNTGMLNLYLKLKYA